MKCPNKNEDKDVEMQNKSKRQSKRKSSYNFCEMRINFVNNNLYLLSLVQPLKLKCRTCGKTYAKTYSTNRWYNVYDDKGNVIAKTCNRCYVHKKGKIQNKKC